MHITEILPQFPQDNEWESPEQAQEVLQKFCIWLNYHFQGYDCDMEMDEKW
jgi:hypothetical protein